MLDENGKEGDCAYLVIAGVVHGLGVGGGVSSCGCSQPVGDLSQVGIAEVGDRVGAITRRRVRRTLLGSDQSGVHWGWV
jgi:hypothetical protein